MIPILLGIRDIYQLFYKNAVEERMLK